MPKVWALPKPTASVRKIAACAWAEWSAAMIAASFEENACVRSWLEAFPDNAANVNATTANEDRRTLDIFTSRQLDEGRPAYMRSQFRFALWRHCLGWIAACGESRRIGMATGRAMPQRKDRGGGSRRK